MTPTSRRRVKTTVTLKPGSWVTQGHRNWHHSIACIWFPITIHSNFAPLSRYDDILVENRQKNQPTLIWHVPLGWPLANFLTSHTLPETCGRLTRGAQLTAGYTVNTYSKPPLYYTLGAVAPLLPSLRMAAVLRTAHTLGPGGPLPHADRHATRDRHDLSCKLGTRVMGLSDGVHFTILLSLC